MIWKLIYHAEENSYLTGNNTSIKIEQPPAAEPSLLRCVQQNQGEINLGRLRGGQCGQDGGVVYTDIMPGGGLDGDLVTFQGGRCRRNRNRDCHRLATPRRQGNNLIRQGRCPAISTGQQFKGIHHYNTIGPYSSLGYRLPAPEAIISQPSQIPQFSLTI